MSAQTIAAAAELIADRLQEHAISADDRDRRRAATMLPGDENRVRQILYNLLSNAANYAPEGSTIKLTCRRLESGVEFSVHDDGPGMPPEVLDTVFRRFEPRANGGRRRGAGLGLSIVKSFVELHGGKVAHRDRRRTRARRSSACFRSTRPACAPRRNERRYGRGARA